MTTELSPGYVLTVTASGGSSGTLQQIPQSGSTTAYPQVAVAAGTSVSVGPFAASRNYYVGTLSGQVGYSVSKPDNELVTADKISEATAGDGLLIDGVSFKDGKTNGGLLTQTLNVSGDFVVGSGMLMIDHATVVIAANLAKAKAGDRVCVVNSSASGNASHSVKASAGSTFDGTNNKATLNSRGEALELCAISETRWLVINNVGGVTFSAV
jgi:hypothetical protein